MKNLKYWWITAGVAWLLVGSMAFWGGFHAVDYSRNVLKMSLELRLDYNSFADTTLGGKLLPFDAVYAIGLKQMILGFFMGIVGSALLCYGASRKSKSDFVFDYIVNQYGKARKTKSK